MRRVEVLVATMEQADFSKYEKMNIQTDVIFANQSDQLLYRSELIKDRQAKMITTPTRGVGINRNIALANSTGDYVIFADDDVTYTDGYEDIVKKAFRTIPKADILIFNIEIQGTRKKKINNRIKKINITNFFPYGTVRIVAKRDNIVKNNIWFSHLFGGGSRYGSGEDSLFLRTAIKNGLKIYTYPETIASVDTTDSTWFEGYNKKYFFDKGAWLKAAFPKMYNLMIILFAYRFISRTNYSFSELKMFMKKGVMGFKNGKSYVESSLD